MCTSMWNEEYIGTYVLTQLTQFSNMTPVIYTLKFDLEFLELLKGAIVAFKEQNTQLA